MASVAQAPKGGEGTGGLDPDPDGALPQDLALLRDELHRSISAALTQDVNKMGKDLQDRILAELAPQCEARRAWQGQRSSEASSMASSWEADQQLLSHLGVQRHTGSRAPSLATHFKETPKDAPDEFGPSLREAAATLPGKVEPARLPSCYERSPSFGEVLVKPKKGLFKQKTVGKKSFGSFGRPLRRDGTRAGSQTERTIRFREALSRLTRDSHSSVDLDIGEGVACLSERSWPEWKNRMGRIVNPRVHDNFTSWWAEFSDAVLLLVTSDTFDYLVGVLLLSHAVCIGLSVEVRARSAGMQPHSVFRIMEAVFCALFSLELLLRVIATGRDFFCRNSDMWKWNLYDTFMVLSHVMEEIFLAAADDSRADLDAVQLSGKVADIAQFLRFFRIMRLLRMIRLVRLLGELRKLTYLIMASFESFVWALAMLGMLTYIVAVIFTQLVVESPAPHADENLVRWFGTVGDSFHSLYQAIAGGADWGDMSRLLISRVSPWCGLIFAVYVAFAVLVLLNLVTGVFVEGAMKLTTRDKEEEIVRNICKAFQDEELRKTGCISYEKWTDRVESVMGQKMQDGFTDDPLSDIFESIELNMMQADELFGILDADGDGAITATEFARGSLQLQSPAKALDIALLSRQLAKCFETIQQVTALMVGGPAPVKERKCGLLASRKSVVAVEQALGNCRIKGPQVAAARRSTRRFSGTQPLVKPLATED